MEVLNKGHFDPSTSEKIIGTGTEKLICNKYVWENIASKKKVSKESKRHQIHLAIFYWFKRQFWTIKHRRNIKFIDSKDLK